MGNGGCESCKAQSIIESKGDTQIYFAIIVILMQVDVKSFLIQNSSNVVIVTGGVESMRRDQGESSGLV